MKATWSQSLLLLLLGTMRAEAETFDCQRPSIPLARLICGDAVLRAADAEENEIYDTALTASLDKSALREEERAWFAAEILPYNWFAQQHAPIDNAKIVETYRQRGDALRQETQLWRQAASQRPGTSLATSCIALPMYPHTDGLRCCRLTRRSKATSSLRYQRQIYPQHPRIARVIVLAAIAGPRRCLAAACRCLSAKLRRFRAPQMIASPAGTLAGHRGNQASNGEDAAALYRLQPGLACRYRRPKLARARCNRACPMDSIYRPHRCADYAKCRRRDGHTQPVELLSVGGESHDRSRDRG